MDYMIEARQIKRCFSTKNEDFWALKGIDLQVPAGKLTILKGRSGSGKTTLLNILSALDAPTAGTLFFDGKNITGESEKNLTKIRRKEIGFVFQSVALIPMMSALENVEFVLRLSGYKGKLKDRAMECLKLVGLSNRANHLPQELSGGEQQRVAIARAIAHRPKVIFADEPTGALDTATGLSVVRILKELTEKEGVTIVMTTHDVGLMDYGDRVYEIEGGELVHGEE